MKTEYDWLLECAARPDDDRLREVFADFLEERGDELRARYIRVSIKLDRQPAAQQNLREKGWAMTVLKENRARWLGPLVETAPEDCWYFERGLPLGLEVFMAQKFRPATLEKSSCLPLINSLFLTENFLCDEGAASLAALPLVNLTTLYLNMNAIGPPGVEALAAARHWTKLQSLTFRDNDLRSQGAAALAQSPLLAGLVELHIESTNIGGEGVRALVESNHLTNLKTLTIRSERIGNPGARLLASAPNLEQLTRLDLGANFISDDGAVALAASETLKNLTYLNLQLNTIGENGRDALHRVFGPSYDDLTYGSSR